MGPHPCAGAAAHGTGVVALPGAVGGCRNHGGAGGGGAAGADERGRGRLAALPGGGYRDRGRPGQAGGGARAGHAAAGRVCAAGGDVDVRHSARLRRRGDRPGERGGDAAGEPRRGRARADYLHGRGALRTGQQRRDYPGSGRGGAAGGAGAAAAGDRFHGGRLRVARRGRFLPPARLGGGARQGAVLDRVLPASRGGCAARPGRPHRARHGRRLLEETGLFALHVPFRSLPEETMAGLVQRHVGCDSAAAARFLARRKFAGGTAPGRGGRQRVFGSAVPERGGAAGGAPSRARRGAGR